MAAQDRVLAQPQGHRSPLRP